VMHIRTGILEKPPTEKEDTRAEFILVRVKVEGRTIMILNSDKWGQYLRPLSSV